MLFVLLVSNLIINVFLVCFQIFMSLFGNFNIEKYLFLCPLEIV